MDAVENIQCSSLCCDVGYKLIPLICSRNPVIIAVCWCFGRGLLGEVQPLLQSHSPQLRQLMDEHGLEEVPDTEELWEVPEPKIIIPPKPSMLFALLCLCPLFKLDYLLKQHS